MAWYQSKKAAELHTMGKDRILVFDTETTGFGNSDEIIQITLMNGYGSVLFDSYIKPKHKRFWPIAKKKNHLSYEMIKEYPTFNEVKDQIQYFFNNADVVVGYNVSFDIRFVKNAGIIVSGSKFDVMTEFARYHADIDKTGYKTCSLEACADYFGYSYQAHDSASDTEATLYCFNQLIGDSIFTTYKRKEKKKLKAELKETHERKKTKFSIQFKSRNIPFFIKSIILIVIGELLYYYQYQSLIRQFSDYLRELERIIGERPLNYISCIALILIGCGWLHFLRGIIKTIFRIPRWLSVKIKRLLD